MDFDLWLKIWLAVLAVPVTIGCFPYIVMYFRVNGRPMWEHPFWHENPIGRWLIPMPRDGYSPETWTAIRPMPLLYLLVGIGYFVFFGLALAGSVWAYPAGLIVLPLVLHDMWLFDFGMDAAWEYGGYTRGLIIQELLVTAAILVPLIWLVQDVTDHIGSAT